MNFNHVVIVIRMQHLNLVFQIYRLIFLTMSVLVTDKVAEAFYLNVKISLENVV